MVKNKQPYILAVDLDNTLIKTDMIYIGIKFLLLYRIYLLPKLILLFLFNKSKLGTFLIFGGKNTSHPLSKTI